MFFDSELPRKQVSLRGNSQKREDKNDFLLRAQQERELRQIAKKKQVSATKIQAFYRSFKHLQKQKELFRFEFDSQFSSISTNSNTLQLKILLRKLLFFYNEPKDGERLDKLCELLVDNLRNKNSFSDSLVNFCFVASKQEGYLWFSQIKKLFPISQKRLVTNYSFTHLELMIRLSTEGVLKTNQPDNKFINEIYFALLFYMVKQQLYPNIQFLIQKNLELPNSEVLLSSLLSISLKPIQLHKVGTLTPEVIKIDQEFVYSILSIPYLVDRISEMSVNLLIPILPIVLTFVPAQQSSIQWLFGNLCSFFKYILLKNPSIQFLIPVLNFIFHITKLLPYDFYKNLEKDGPLKKQIERFLDQFVVKKLFNTIFVESSITNQNSNTSLFPMGIVSLSEIYYSLMMSEWEACQISLLNTLTFTTPIVKYLWKLLLPFLDINFFFGEKSEIYTLLILFGKCYTHLLLTLDDREFFELQTYFKLDELVNMIQILKKITIKFYISIELKDIDIQLQKILTTLLQSLYDRNSRHQFCAPQVWIAEAHELHLNEKSYSNIIKKIPFVIPFSERLKRLYHMIEKDKSEYFNPFDPFTVTIRRDFVFEDGFSKLNNLGSKLKSNIKVELISSNGAVEPGIDGGGVFKEFLTVLIKTAYNTEYGLFKETSQRYLYPNPAVATIIQDSLSQFEFLGKILGKAVYENILVELPLANFFLAKILGKFNYVNDLVFLDPELHRNLMYLKTCENPEDLSLNFTVVDDIFGSLQVKELISGGKDIPVTNENKFRYIALIANYRLNVTIKQQSEAFMRGFSQIIDPTLIQMFNQHELQTIISGNPGRIDINNFKAFVKYSGGYHANHPVILIFWKVIESFTPEEQSKFLMFVTSCSRPPLLGFQHLYPPFCLHQSIHLESNTDPEEFLPTSSTCMNFLKLPPYSTEAKMRAKLLYAINSKSGFELS